MGHKEVTNMSWSPVPASDGRASHHTFTTDSGVFSLVGVANGSIAMHLEDINNNLQLYICTGAWNVTNAASGLADFTPSAQDLLSTNPLGRAGLYKAYPVVTLGTGPVAMDAQTIQVVALP
jgi:hypothetical protein